MAHLLVWISKSIAIFQRENMVSFGFISVPETKHSSRESEIKLRARKTTDLDTRRRGGATRRPKRSDRQKEWGCVRVRGGPRQLPLQSSRPSLQNIFTVGEELDQSLLLGQSSVRVVVSRALLAHLPRGSICTETLDCGLVVRGFRASNGSDLMFMWAWVQRIGLPFLSSFFSRQ